MGYTKERMYQVWDDKHGDRIEVGPDRDGLDLLEIRQYGDDGKLTASVTMTKERALLVAEAIADIASLLPDG